MRGSGRELRIGDDTRKEKPATKIPNKVCLIGLLGVVIGSGSITSEKNITVGSKMAIFFIRRY